MIPRRVSGFNLPALLPEQGFNVAKALVGTECTCVLVLEAKAKLVHNPPVRSLLVFGYRRHIRGRRPRDRAGEIRAGRSGGTRRHVHRLHEEKGAAPAGHEFHARRAGVAAGRVRRKRQRGG